MASTTGRFTRPQDEALPGMPEVPGPTPRIVPVGLAHQLQTESIQLSGDVGVAQRENLDKLAIDDEVVITITNADGQVIGHAQMVLTAGAVKRRSADGMRWLEKVWTIGKGT